MAVPKDRFWAKVLFKEFIRHYRKLNDEEIVRDVKQSMDDLDDLNEDGETFGAKMVKWSNERRDTPRAEAARANGALGGRPPSNQPPPIPQKPPKDMQEVYDFASSQGIWLDFARTWFAKNFEERDGVDMAGNRIKNWKGALVNDWKKNGGK